MKRFLLAATALVLVAAPSLSSAQSWEGRGRGGGREAGQGAGSQNDGQRGGGWRGGGGGDGGGRQGWAGRGERSAEAQAQMQAQVQARSEARAREQAERQAQGGGAWAGQDRSGVGQIRRGVPNPDRQGFSQNRDWNQDRQNQTRDWNRGQNRGDDNRAWNRQGQNRGDNRDWSRDRNDGRFDNGQRFDNRQRYDNSRRYDSNRYNGSGWNNGRNDRYDNRFLGNRWDSRSRSWNRSSNDWWRGRPEFRGFSGVRSGFWFMPSYGYIQVDPIYYGRAWRIGDYVPSPFRRYTVVDPYIYGLDPPPYGCEWVYLGDDIVLMELRTGRIIDVLPDFY